MWRLEEFVHLHLNSPSDQLSRRTLQLSFTRSDVEGLAFKRRISICASSPFSPYRERDRAT